MVFLRHLKPWHRDKKKYALAVYCIHFHGPTVFDRIKMNKTRSETPKKEIDIPRSSKCVKFVPKFTQKTYQKAEILHIWKIQVYKHHQISLLNKTN